MCHKEDAQKPIRVFDILFFQARNLKTERICDAMPRERTVREHALRCPEQRGPVQPDRNGEGERSRSPPLSGVASPGSAKALYHR